MPRPTILWILNSQSETVSMAGAMEFYRRDMRGHFFIKGCTVKIVQQCGHPYIGQPEPFCPSSEKPCDCTDYDFSATGNTRTRHHHLRRIIK